MPKSARLLERWRFPPNIVSAVRFHHAPKGAGKSQRSLASYVYIADMIAHLRATVMAIWRSL